MHKDKTCDRHTSQQADSPSIIKVMQRYSYTEDRFNSQLLAGGAAGDAVYSSNRVHIF